MISHPFPSVPTSLLYGSLLGLSQFVATLLVFAFGLHGSADDLARSHKPESILGLILMMLVLGFAHRAAKKAALDRGAPELSLGAAAKLAALTALAGGIVTGLGQWLYVRLINPGLVDIQRAAIMERVGPDLEKLSAEELAAVTEKIEFATSAAARALVYGINTLVFAAILGIAYALIFRAAVRRDRKTGEHSA